MYAHIYICVYIYMYMHIYIYIVFIYIYTCIFVYIYIEIWAGAHPPPAFCDISKSHELRQFRVKGLGYMSLGFRFPNFPISHFPNRAGPSGLVSFGKLEIGKYVPVIISQ